MDDRISRRKALKRIGIGAGAVWAAPVVTSVGAHAMAQGTPAGNDICSGCNTDYCGAASGCAFDNGGTQCNDGSPGFCDTTVEGKCVCNVAPFIADSDGCTSSAECARTYGSGVVCIHADCRGAGHTVCIDRCHGETARSNVRTVNGRTGG